MAGIAVGARKGLEDPDSLKKAEEMYVNVNIHSEAARDQLARLKALPDSCAASADALQQSRAAFEECGVFSPRLIDGILNSLRAYNDADLRADIAANPDIQSELVARFWHY